MKFLYKLAIIIALSVIIMTFFSGNIYAAFSWDKIQSDVSTFLGKGKTDSPISVSSMTSELLPIGQTLSAIATAVLLGAAAIMGVKYMFANPEEQAKLKQQLVGLVLAAIIIFGAFNIWNLLRQVFEGILG